MEDLLSDIDNLKRKIDKLPIINEIDTLYNTIINNKELIDMIKKYNISKDNSLRIKIYKDKDFQRYKKYETDLNLLIMEINKRLGKISIGRSCNHDSN